MEEDERMWIHMDLVVEILSRMPVKSLMKFKCLSKEFSRIIHSRNFVDSCLSCSSSRSRLLFFFRNSKTNTLVFFSAPHRSTCAIAPTRHDMIFRGGVNVSFTSPPVRGLMLCAIGHNQLFICNPATRQTLSLPQNLMLVERDNLTELLILGYDPIFDQFKVLCIWDYPNARPSTYLQFWVLTVGQDGNMWRKIQGMPPHLYPVTSSHTCGHGGICINGVLYFKAYSCTPSRHHLTLTKHVVSFDLNTEVFSLVKPNDHLCWVSRLIDFQGKLAFISRVKMDCTVEFCILENKEEWSSKVFHLPWTQSYSKDYMKTSASVLGIHDGDIVFTPQGELGYTWHLSLEKRTVRKVLYEIPITKPYPLAFFFANHVDTTISL
ncbi:PREDICTED: F-box protein At1g30790-like [Camelina sativa]|uniref:F-box protein At1g30790-like n=1 Tax=Camelina sativa TaxID=90675 RepID=A0ABM0Y3W8_CAMSA|nr:PREDICTED: F-box protein At1g30790-like [Camelina sativa]